MARTVTLDYEGSMRYYGQGLLPAPSVEIPWTGCVSSLQSVPLLAIDNEPQPQDAPAHHAVGPSLEISRARAAPESLDISGLIIGEAPIHDCRVHAPAVPPAVAHHACSGTHGGQSLAPVCDKDLDLRKLTLDAMAVGEGLKAHVASERVRKNGDRVSKL